MALQITHASRVIDPSTGFTKLDLLQWYAGCADWALPHLRGRPAYIRHAPAGLGGALNFLQHANDFRGLKPADPALWPGHDPAIAFETAEDLVAAAQYGMVEIHTWNSTSAAIERPDRLVFDLDPGEGVPWVRLVEGALLLRSLLEELGLQAWAKTTGGKGLHLYVPLAPEHGYELAKALTRSIVEHMAKILPDRFVAKSGPRNRQGRIFIDFLRNGWVQSTAEAYSARARPGMGVSMPVGWDELGATESGAHWDLRSGLHRLAALRADPWAGYRKTPQRLDTALSVLSAPGLTPGSSLSAGKASAPSSRPGTGSSRPRRSPSPR